MSHVGCLDRRSSLLSSRDDLTLVLDDAHFFNCLFHMSEHGPPIELKQVRVLQLPILVSLNYTTPVDSIGR
jgi:hypothetical protein